MRSPFDKRKTHSDHETRQAMKRLSDITEKHSALDDKRARGQQPVDTQQARGEGADRIGIEKAEPPVRIGGGHEKSHVGLAEPLEPDLAPSGGEVARGEQGENQEHEVGRTMSRPDRKDEEEPEEQEKRTYENELLGHRIRRDRVSMPAMRPFADGC